jgi:hypothetical protein
MFQAVNRARESAEAEANERSVYDHLLAIIFMGTPHRGSSWANLGKTLSNLARLAGLSVNDQIVQSLTGSSETLNRVRDSFRNSLDAGPFFVTSCREGRGFSRVGYFNFDARVLVPEPPSFAILISPTGSRTRLGRNRPRKRARFHH